jgi:pentatricopeptide repeat protein
VQAVLNLLMHMKIPLTAQHYFIMIHRCFLHSEHTTAVDICMNVIRHPVLLQEKSVTILVKLLFHEEENIPIIVDLLNVMKQVGFKLDSIIYTVLIAGCTKFRDFKQATQFFLQARELDVNEKAELPTAVLQMLCISNQIEEALSYYMDVKDRISIDHVLYSVLISGCTSAKRFDIADQIYTDLIQRRIPLSKELSTSIIKMYCASNRVDNAVSIFNSQLSTSNTVDATSYAVLLTGLVTSGRFDSAEQLHEDFLHSGIALTPVLSTALIKMYCLNGRVDDAITIFKDMDTPTSVTYTVLIAGCTATRKFDLADQLYSEVRHHQIPQDEMLINTVLSMYCSSDRFSMAWNLYISMEKTMKIPISGVTLGIMIQGCMQANNFKKLDAVCGRIYNEQVPLTVSLTNTLISMYFDRAMPEKSYEVFHKHMKTIGSPTLDMFILLLTDVSSQEFSYSIAQKITTGEFVHPLNTCILILCYARRGRYAKARELFDQSEKDMNMWQSMLTAYKMGGKGKLAVEIVNLMQASSIKPDARAYITALSACAHSGRIDEAKELVQYLQTNKILTDKHLSCMIDALSRLGKLDEAETLALSLKTYQPTAWMSILGGCKKFNDHSRSKRIVQHISGRARKTAANILLANTYASAGIQTPETLYVAGWMRTS